jgi:hypothetical protein
MEGNYVEIGGEFFKIEGDLDLEFYSPFIDAEEINIQGESINPRGNYIMPLTLTGTPALARALQNPQLTQLRNRVNTINNVTVYSNGRRIDKGSIDIQRVPHNLDDNTWSAECTFATEGATFSELAGNKNLRELVLHGVVDIVGEQVDALLSRINQHDSTHFDTNGTGWLFTKGAELQAWVGYNFWRYIYDNFDDRTHRISDYVNSILQGIDPYDVDSTWANKPALGYFVFPSYYGEWEGAEFESQSSILNHYSPDPDNYKSFHAELHTSGEDWVKYTSLRNQFVPMYFAHKVLQHCFSELGFTVEGELFDDEDFLKLILPNTYSILREEVLTVEDLWGTNDELQNLLYSQANTTIDPKNHLPDWSILDFLRDIMLKFNVYFFFDGKRVVMRGNTLGRPKKNYDSVAPQVIGETKKAGGVTVKYKFEADDKSYDEQRKFLEKIATGVVETVDGSILSGLANGTTYLQNNLNAIFKKDTAALGDTVLQVNNLVPYITGTDKVLESELTPVEMGARNYNTSNDPYTSNDMQAYLPLFGHEPTYYYTKVVLMKWISLSPFGDYHNFTVLDMGEWELVEGSSEKKIALYHGLQKTLETDGAGFEYPYMSFHNYAPVTGADVKLGNWHLGWHGAEGLIATHWREWIKVFSAWKQTYLVPLLWEDIVNHDWTASDIIRSGKYYISAIKFKMPNLLNKIKAVVEALEL